MKKFILLSMLLGLSTITSANNSMKGEKPCTAPGVPYSGCVCFDNGVCIDIDDIGVHPKK